MASVEGLMAAGIGFCDRRLCGAFSGSRGRGRILGGAAGRPGCDIRGARRTGGMSTNSSTRIPMRPGRLLPVGRVSSMT